MKIFLVFVRDEDFYHLLPKEVNKSNSSEIVRVMAFPPLGIQTLAPVLRQFGHDVRMFDTCHPEMKQEYIAQALIDEHPDVIALSFLSVTSYRLLKKMARKLKTTTPDIPIIVGGPFVSGNATNILNDIIDIDCVGSGEGEELLPDYIENLSNPGVVKGLAWRQGDTVVENPARPLIQNLDRYPFPDRKGLPIEYIESLPLDMPAVLSMDKFTTMQTSRGCPFQCIYCDIPSLNGGKWRSKSAEYVLAEMQELNDEGYKSIYLTDDHFLIDRKRIQAVCEGIIARKFQFHWGCEGRVDSVGVSQLPLMVNANCNMLAFGVEAGTQKVLDRLKKHQTLDQVKTAVSQAKKHGIKTVHGFFVVGSPNETKADILESFRFAARLNLDSFGFNRLCVYRGTPLWQEYVNRGLIDDKRDWNKWFKCSEVDPTALPEDIVHNTRKKGFILLFSLLIFRYPIKTFRLIRRFSRFMKFSNVLKLFLSPFRKINHHVTAQISDEDTV